MINNLAVNLHKEYRLSALNLGNEYVVNELLQKFGTLPLAKC